MLVLSFYLVYNAFSGGTLGLNTDEGAGAFLRSFFSNSSAGIVVIALAGTYGVYVVASFLYMDPWHIFTSSWAYFFGMTTSINILMVYAFCNWHDVSWGTKGSDKGDSLPSAQTKKDDLKSNFVEEIDKPQADIDSQFESTVKRALAPFVEPEEGDEKSLDDSYKSFRTNLVLLWVFSNLIVSLLITSEGISKLCLTVSLPILTLKHCVLINRRIRRRREPGTSSRLFCIRQLPFRVSVSLEPAGSLADRVFCAVSKGDNLMVYIGVSYLIWRMMHSGLVGW